MGPGIAGSKRVIGWWSKTSKRGTPARRAGLGGEARREAEELAPEGLRPDAARAVALERRGPGGDDRRRGVGVLDPGVGLVEQVPDRSRRWPGCRPRRTAASGGCAGSPRSRPGSGRREAAAAATGGRSCPSSGWLRPRRIRRRPGGRGARPRPRAGSAGGPRPCAHVGGALDREDHVEAVRLGVADRRIDPAEVVRRGCRGSVGSLSGVGCHRGDPEPEGADPDDAARRARPSRRRAGRGAWGPRSRSRARRRRSGAASARHRRREPRRRRAAGAERARGGHAEAARRAAAAMRAPDAALRQLRDEALVACRPSPAGTPCPSASGRS